MAKLHMHPIGLALIVFGLLSWVIAIGGLGATTAACQRNKPEGVSKTYCATTYQIEWWSVWFEFILLVVMLGTVFVNAFQRARFIYLSYLSMVSVLLTIAARNLINKTFATGGIDLKDYTSAAYNAAAAGCILLGITNYALIIFVGLSATGQNFNDAGRQPAEVRYQPSSF